MRGVQHSERCFFPAHIQLGRVPTVEFHETSPTYHASDSVPAVVVAGLTILRVPPRTRHQRVV